MLFAMVYNALDSLRRYIEGTDDNFGTPASYSGLYVLVHEDATSSVWMAFSFNTTDGYPDDMSEQRIIDTISTRDQHKAELVELTITDENGVSRTSESSAFTSRHIVTRCSHV